MKTQTAREYYEENIDETNIPREHYEWEIIQLMHDHTTAQIEALRERLRETDSLYPGGEIIFEVFLKEINDGKI
jgi:hypothetical protein